MRRTFDGRAGAARMSVVVVVVMVMVVSWELHFQFLSHAGKVRPQQNLPDRETFKGCPEFSWTSMTD